MSEKLCRQRLLPTYSRHGRWVSIDIQSEGESGRGGFHPLHFCKIAGKGSCKASIIINVLWPFVPVAMVLDRQKSGSVLGAFVINYIAMLPAAHLLGFAGQQLAQKLPGVLGLLLEVTLGSVVEMILFLVLITRKQDGDHHHPIVIKAAILGSILANLLLCLGLCCFVGGLRRHEQHFHEAVSEVASGLLLVAGVALLIPSAFYSALQPTAFRPGNHKSLTSNGHPRDGFPIGRLEHDTLGVSRWTAIVLFAAFFLFIFYNINSHEGIFDELLVADEAKDADRQRNLVRAKFTMTESIVALAISITLVSTIAIYLVSRIEPMVKIYGIPDEFMGLILVPLAEKTIEHLTAIAKAWDDQMNCALFHCLGSSIQTALFNAPLVIIVGWGLNDDQMNLNFEIFQVAMLLLAIVVVGNFVRDKKSNYLEGGLLVLVYVIVALTTWFYPDPSLIRSNPGDESTKAPSVVGQ